MNINEYEYTGFKLFTRKYKTSVYPDKETKYENKFNIIIQYKKGLPFKYWSQEVLKDTDTGLEWDRWCSTMHIQLTENDTFIRNMSEEEVFGVLL